MAQHLFFYFYKVKLMEMKRTPLTFRCNFLSWHGKFIKIIHKKKIHKKTPPENVQQKMVTTKIAQIALIKGTYLLEVLDAIVLSTDLLHEALAVQSRENVTRSHRTPVATQNVRKMCKTFEIPDGHQKFQVSNMEVLYVIEKGGTTHTHTSARS